MGFFHVQPVVPHVNGMTENNESPTPVDLILTPERANAMQSAAQTLFNSMSDYPGWRSAVYTFSRAEDGEITEVVVVTDADGEDSEEVPAEEVHLAIVFARVQFRLEDTSSFQTLAVSVTADGAVDFRPVYPTKYAVSLVVPS